MLIQPPRGDYDKDVPGAYEKDLQSWRAQLGLDGPLRAPRGPAMISMSGALPAQSAAANVGGGTGGEQKPIRFGLLSVPKKRSPRPVATVSIAGFSSEDVD